MTAGFANPTSPLRGIARTRVGAFTLVELLVAISIIMLLVLLTLASTGRVRSQAVATKCSTNLRAVAQSVAAYATSHSETLAAALRQRDWRWSESDPLGWDIVTGTWAELRGGRATIWQCPAQETPFMANTRAVGLDTRLAVPNGRIHSVTLRQWHEPARLVVAYDLQSDLLESLYAHAALPDAGDISDEMYTPWPRDNGTSAIPVQLERLGPHQDGYGVVFGDGHVRVGTFSNRQNAVYWSGPRWWPAKYKSRHVP